MEYCSFFIYSQSVVIAYLNLLILCIYFDMQYVVV
jgi:hypothetical protein